MHGEIRTSRTESRTWWASPAPSLHLCLVVLGFLVRLTWGFQAGILFELHGHDGAGQPRAPGALPNEVWQAGVRGHEHGSRARGARCGGLRGRHGPRGLGSTWGEDKTAYPRALGWEALRQETSASPSYFSP